MKTQYSKLETSLILVEVEEGFLAASKENVVNDDTSVVIDRQEGGNDINFGNLGWD